MAFQDSGVNGRILKIYPNILYTGMLNRADLQNLINRFNQFSYSKS